LILFAKTERAKVSLRQIPKGMNRGLRIEFDEANYHAKAQHNARRKLPNAGG
jgi:hypothetical protein